MNATVTPFPTASGAVAAGASAFVGATVRETGGVSGAVVRLRDGTVTGVILANISLDASESVRDQVGPLAVTHASGIYVQVVSGSVEGSVYTLT